MIHDLEFYRRVAVRGVTDALVGPGLAARLPAVHALVVFSHGFVVVKPSDLMAVIVDIVILCQSPMKMGMAAIALDGAAAATQAHRLGTIEHAGVYYPKYLSLV